MLSWCARAGVSATDAEDVTQEVFVAVAAALDGFRRDRPGDTFRGWLRVITRNQVLQLFRKNRGRPQAVGGSAAWEDLQEVADPLPGPGDDESVEIGQLYQRALELVRGEFEERTWRMFWQAVIDGRSPVDVAAEMGVSPAAVRKAKSRVLHRLRQEVGDLID